MPIYTAEQLRNIADSSTAKADSIIDELMEQMNQLAEYGQYEIAFPATPNEATATLIKDKLVAVDLSFTVEDTEGAYPYTKVKWAAT